MFNEMREQNRITNEDNRKLRLQLAESQKEINKLLEEVRNLQKILNQRTEINIPEFPVQVQNDNTKKRKKSKSKKTNQNQIESKVTAVNELNFPTLNSTDTEETPIIKKLKQVNNDDQLSVNLNTENNEMESDWEDKNQNHENDTDMSDNESLTKFQIQPPKRERIPPIMVKDPNHTWNSIKNKLKKLKTTNFTGKLFADEIKINLSTIEDFKNVKKYLR